MPQLIVSIADLQARIAQSRRVSQRKGAEPNGSGRQHSRPQRANAYIAPSNAVERSIAGIWQELLGVEPIGIYDNFFEMGGHSLMATHMMVRLSNTFRVELPVRSIFEATTIADLALLIVKKQAEQVDKEQLAQLLADIRRLAPDELRARLATQKRQLEENV